MKDIPNILTIFRMLAIPILILMLYNEGRQANFAAALIFAVASLTDFFDGYLARILSAQSIFGKLFDPIADKLIITATIMMLIYKGKVANVDVLAAIIIVTREIFVSGLREFASNLKITISVSKIGKAKTAVQVIALVSIILSDGYDEYHLIGMILLWISAVISVVSAYEYSRKIFTFGK